MHLQLFETKLPERVMKVVNRCKARERYQPETVFLTQFTEHLGSCRLCKCVIMYPPLEDGESCEACFG